MKNAKYMDEENIIEKGVDLLIKGLGPVQAIRFMNISKAVKMESVKRHRLWQKQLDKEKFFKEVFS
jgi:hypothetical protein